jgi:outer membrane protein assembly factor BamB
MLSRRAAVATFCLSLLLLLSAFFFPLGSPGRSAAPSSPEPAVSEAVSSDLSPTLYLQWVRDLPPLRGAWPDQPLLQFDVAYQPVVAGKTLFLASSRADGVAAFDAETGDALWRFFTDGPVRFAPVVWRDKVYFASDDGWLYCVAADDGDLLWKFRGGPSDRKVLGNQRLISTWPARGAPAVVEEPNGEAVVYFAAGIWPFMGVFLHALDARTGAVRWTNDGDGSLYIKQPHQVDAFAGVAPQGQLAVVGDRLLVPCGRSVPACYDRRTGKLLHFRLADDSKYGGGAYVVAGPAFFVNGDGAFDLATGKILGVVGDHAVLTDDVLYASTPTDLRAYDVVQAGRPASAIDRLGRRIQQPAWKPAPAVVAPLPGVQALTVAGSRLYAATAGKVFAIERPLTAGKPRISWQASIEGRPVHLLAADGRLFVSTREGRLYCFGPDPGDAMTHPLPVADDEPDDDWPDKTRDLLAHAGARDGYCIAWGVGSGRLITELIHQSRFHVVAVEPDADKAEAFRAEMCKADLYGNRVAVVVASPDAVRLPAYLAELMVSEDLGSAGVVVGPDFLGKAFASLRPYGGAAFFPIGAEDQAQFTDLIDGAGLANARVRTAGEWMVLSREGPLPGAADWTHEHADAANTRVSRDQIVRAPLGMLWFGGPSHDGILPRHGHGPQPQVVGGRLFIEGVDFLRAVDVYTGRLLWEARLPGLGDAYDNTFHQAGANAGGSNYVSTSDGIYIAYKTTCVRLDPATGAKTASFTMPSFPNEKTPPVWDWITVAGDVLIGGANPASGARTGGASPVSASKRLMALDRNTGRPLWTLEAKTSFRHNAVCVGAGRLYAIDRPSSDQLDWLTRRGDSPAAKPRLIAVDLHSGKEIWKATDGVFGAWLSYSEKYDILIEAGRNARDTLSDEPKGMRAYRGDRGNPLWFQPKYAGPAMIHGDMVLRDGGGCDLHTGAATMRADPLTGVSIEWTWSRNYGCNTPAASENLLTFRSGAAGYYDLANDGGTGNLGGFRSSCTNNLIVADGVLNAPDYTRGCTCSYQNQASLALAPMADAEEWTFFTAREVKGVVRRVGLNLGAPGCRRGDDGTLWLEYPPVGGPAPRPAVSVSPTNPDWFRRHSSQVTGDGPSWVGASGAKNLRSLTVTLSRNARPTRAYTVRLTFMEPDDLRGGRRVFDVALQGRPVLKEFDVSEDAGGRDRSVTKEFRGIRIGRDLTVTLTPAGPDTTSAPLLCGVEVTAEGW